MDTRADIVEVFEDESGKKDSRTGKTQQLRRYKDDAYRYSLLQLCLASAHLWLPVQTFTHMQATSTVCTMSVRL